MTVNLSRLIDQVEARANTNRLGKLIPREMDKDIVVLRDALEALIEVRKIVRESPHSISCPLSPDGPYMGQKCDCGKAQFEEM